MRILNINGFFSNLVNIQDKNIFKIMIKFKVLNQVINKKQYVFIP